MRMVCDVGVRFQKPAPCPSWASISSSRSRRHRGRQTAPVTGEELTTRPPSLPRANPRSTGEIPMSTVQGGKPTCDLREVLDVKERSEEHSPRSGPEHPVTTKAHNDCSLWARWLVVLLSSPSESRVTAGCHGSRRATPMEFTWNGLGNAAKDCSSVLAPRSDA